MNGIGFSRKWTGAALALVLGLGGRRDRLRRRPRKGSVTASHVRASLKLADPSEGPSKTGFAPVVKEVLPNVVNISSSKVVRTPNQMPEGMQSDPFFQQFFGRIGGRLRGNGRNDRSRKSGASRAWARASS